MRPSEREPFSWKGAWWRPDGAERADATEPRPGSLDGMGMEEGLRAVDASSDPLYGRDAACPCHGTVRSVPDGAYRLELPGASDRVFDYAGPHYTVHGIGEDHAPCSLLDCFTTSSPRSMFGGGYRSVEVVGHLFVHGAHVNDAKDFRFASARIELAGLRDFVYTALPDPDGNAVIAIRGEEPLRVRVPGAQLAFVGFQRQKPGRHRLSVEDDAYVRVDLDAAIAYDEWQARWTVPLMNLVEFATREPSRLHDFVAIVHDEGVELPPMVQGRMSEEAFSRREVAFAQPRGALRETEPRHGYERILLSASALGSEFESALQRWFELTASRGSATGVLFGTLNSRMYVTSQLVVLASVAEAYHRTIDNHAPMAADVHQQVTQRVLDSLDDDEQRAFYERKLRYVNQISQEERVIALLRRAGSIIAPLSNHPGRLSTRITATRNEVVHLPAVTANVLAGRDLVEAVELLVLALHVNVLVDLGVPAQHAAALLERSYGQQLFWQRLQRRDCAWPKKGSPATN